MKSVSPVIIRSKREREERHVDEDARPSKSPCLEEGTSVFDRQNRVPTAQTAMRIKQSTVIHGMVQEIQRLGGSLMASAELAIKSGEGLTCLRIANQSEDLTMRLLKMTIDASRGPYDLHRYSTDIRFASKRRPQEIFGLIIENGTHVTRKVLNDFVKTEFYLLRAESIDVFFKFVRKEWISTISLSTAKQFPKDILCRCIDKLSRETIQQLVLQRAIKEDDIALWCRGMQQIDRMGCKDWSKELEIATHSFDKTYPSRMWEYANITIVKMIEGSFTINAATLARFMSFVDDCKDVYLTRDMCSYLRGAGYFERIEEAHLIEFFFEAAQ